MPKIVTQFTCTVSQNKHKHTRNTQEICLNLVLNMLNCYEVCLYLKFKLLTQSKEIALAAACISKHLYVKVLLYFSLAQRTPPPIYRCALLGAGWSSHPDNH